MDSSISEFEHIHCCKLGFQPKIKNRMANSVDPDETAHYELSHLALHCLHRYLYMYWSVGMKRLTKHHTQGPVVQSVISLTSLLMKTR